MRLLGPIADESKIDVNVFTDRWPFRGLPHDEPAKLVKKLREGNVTAAWAASFDGLLHRDISAVNARVVKLCGESGDGILKPVGTINPMLPDWQTDLRQCVEQHGMFAIRIHPDYHGYDLTDPRFAELLDLAAKSQLVVQMPVLMEDPRTQHPLARVTPVDTTPLPELLAARPDVRLMILNGLKQLRGEALAKLSQLKQISFESAMLEGVGCYEKILTQIPPERLLFGSLSPLFYFESAVLKLQESKIGAYQTKHICRKNAALLMEKR